MTAGLGRALVAASVLAFTPGAAAACGGVTARIADDQ